MTSTLIALVLALLVQLQQPNVPVEMKIQGLQLAQKILVIAQQEQVAVPAPVFQPIPQPAPVAETPPADTGSAVAVPQVSQLSCAFGAVVVTWSQGTRHAKFSWTFTPGASAYVDADLFLTARVPTSIHSSNSLMQEDTYGPTIFQDTTYTLSVSKDGATTQCQTTAQI